MPEPIREEVLANLKTTLQGVTVANGYTYDVACVVRGEITPNRLQSFPAIVFDDLGETYDRLNNNSHHKELRVGLLGVLKVTTGATDDVVRQACGNLLADIEQALMVDRCRGGFAVDTLLQSNDVESGEAVRPYAFVVLELLAKYRTNLTNPRSKT